MKQFTKHTTCRFDINTPKKQQQQQKKSTQLIFFYTYHQLKVMIIIKTHPQTRVLPVFNDACMLSSV